MSVRISPWEGAHWWKSPWSEGHPLHLDLSRGAYGVGFTPALSRLPSLCRQRRSSSKIFSFVAQLLEWTEGEPYPPHLPSLGVCVLQPMQCSSSTESALDQCHSLAAESYSSPTPCPLVSSKHLFSLPFVVRGKVWNGRRGEMDLAVVVPFLA